MSHLGRIELFAQILSMANGGASKSKLMHGANLSLRQVDDLSENLLESCLLEYSGTEQKFRTTEKGFRFLEGYDELNSMSGNKPRFDDSRLYR